MSPSEDQLRAALRQGQGAGPNVDAIVRNAVRVRSARRERRVRILSAAAVVVVVAAIAFGITRHTDRGAESTAAGKATVQHAADSIAAAGSGASVHGAAGTNGTAGGFAQSLPAPSAASLATCPGKPVQYMLPGGGGTGQFGARDPLVDRPVSSLVFCEYGASATMPTFDRSVTLDGSDAQGFIDSVDASTAARAATLCLTVINVEILPFAANGTALTPLSVSGTCNQVMITNGTGVRYIPETTIDAVFTAAGSNGEIERTPPSGAMSGSPAR